MAGTRWVDAIDPVPDGTRRTELWQLAGFNFTSTATAGSWQTLDMKEGRVATLNLDDLKRKNPSPYH